MSETLRDLVVSLSLDSDNFSRNIRTVNQQIKEAESTFKLAGAGVYKFEKSTQGAQAKVALLREKLTQQNRAVEQYTRALEAANKKLTNSYSRQVDLKKSLSAANTAMEQAKGSVDSAKAAYKSLADSLGETDSATIAAKQNLEQAEQEYANASAEVKKLEGQIKSNTKTLQNNADAISKARTNLNNAKAAVNELSAELKTATSVWTKAGTALEDIGSGMEKAGKKISAVGKTLTKSVSVPIVSLGVTVAKASIDFEDSFASVRKTVDATEQEFRELASASKQMSTEVAASTDDINDVMATGGQLGITIEHLADFTRVMIDLGNSCEDLSATDAATTIAKFANIMGTSQSKFSNIGSTIVDLGNNFATTEASIMEFALRLSGAGKQVGLTEAQVLGFAAALSSVGINAEAGGSAFSKALVQMEVAAATGGEALEDFAKVSGMTANEFKALWDSDPAAAFQAFIEGLAKLDAEGESAIATLNDIGISEVRLRDTLLRSVNATELFTNAQDTANKAWQKNTALTEEANKRYATTKSSLTNLKNTAVLFAQRIGDDLSPTIDNLIDGASGLLEKFMSLEASQRMLIIQLAAYTAAAGPVISILGKLSHGIGSAITSVGKFATAVGEAGGGISGFMTVLGSSPAAIIAITAAATAGTVALIDWASGARAARKALEDMDDVAARMRETQAETLYDKGSGNALARFGLSEEDFTTTAAQDWLAELKKVWSDGEKESNALVEHYAESFKDSSDKVREKIQSRGNLLEGLGTLDDDTQSKMDEDLKQLNAWDTEIANLLKKRQNKLFTEEDQQRLDEVVKLRAELELEYGGFDKSGYDKILEGMDAEIARMYAHGQSNNADPTLYGDVLNGLAEGRKAYNEALDASYDKQYAEIMLIQDQIERTKALDALNKQYNEQREAGEKAYQDSVLEAASQAWEATNAEEQENKLYELAQLLGDGENIDLSALSAWTDGLDEGAMTSMIALAEQLAATGDEDSIARLDGIRSAIEGIVKVAEENDLSGIMSIFGEAIPEEVLRIVGELDMEGATETWDTWKSDKETLNTSGTMDIKLNSLDQATIDAWEAENSSISLTGPKAKVGVALGATWKSELKTKMDAGILKIYGPDGKKIDVTANPQVLDQLDANDIIAVDEDGTYHVMVTFDVGSTEAVEYALEKIEENPAKDTVFSPIFSSTQEDIDRIEELSGAIDAYQKKLDALNPNRDFAEYHEVSGQMGTSKEALAELLGGLSEEDISAMALAASQLTAALSSGDLDSETAAQYKAQLQQILDIISLADEYLGTGNAISEGIAQGMTEFGYDATAATLKVKIMNAINSAMDIHSPSGVMVPTGQNVAAGIAQGMSEYDFSSWISAIASRVFTSAGTEFAGSTLRPVGLQAMNGLAAGINAGRSGVISAMRNAARAAVAAAKAELQIHSPSRVFKDEVGAMTMKGFSEGVISESKKQAATIRNAAKYLTGEAKNGSVVPVSNDNRKTYNSDNSTTFSFAGANFSIRSDQDVHDLAVEIATLTRRQQRGKGFKMA